MSYWVTFHDRDPACFEDSDEAAEFGDVKEIFNLPYPANPRLGTKSSCPAFCYSPETCKGRTACPKGYACSE